MSIYHNFVYRHECDIDGQSIEHQYDYPEKRAPVSLRCDICAERFTVSEIYDARLLYSRISNPEVFG